MTCNEVIRNADRGCKYSTDSFCYSEKSSSQRRLKNAAWTDAFVQRKPIRPTSDCQSVTKTNAGRRISAVTAAVALLRREEDNLFRCFPCLAQTLKTSYGLLFLYGGPNKTKHFPLTSPKFHLLHLFAISRRAYLCRAEKSISPSKRSKL